MSDSASHNPFEAPPVGNRPEKPSIETAPCPNCDQTRVDAPSFTLWGGALGPKLFSHVICRNCGTGFNRKSGKSNTMAITLYVAISLLVGLGIAIMFLFTR